jgi:hypothetical protein
MFALRRIVLFVVAVASAVSTSRVLEFNPAFASGKRLLSH